MSRIDDHLDLFRADWISDPDLLAGQAKQAGNDVFTAELAAWCVEVHGHLSALAEPLEIDLLLMGGNGASLRFGAVHQRGSRDNDYLTAATPEQIDVLMERFASRFAACAPYMQPARYVPKKQVADLDMVTYEIPVELRSIKSDRTVKMEFHFERDLPPSETVTSSLALAGPAMTAVLPELPYQIALKLMTLVRAPVGIEEDTRAAAVPRQIYDVDILIAGVHSGVHWQRMADYSVSRYRKECEHWSVSLIDGEPWLGILERLARWADCTDEAGDKWALIRAMQQSQLKKGVHQTASGWRARCSRLAVAIWCVRTPNGWGLWERARAAAALVPTLKAKRFKNALAELGGMDASDLPLTLNEYTWEALVPTGGVSLADHVARAEALLGDACPELDSNQRPTP